MSPSQRLNAYYAQTGRADLTPAQMRRHKHKTNRDSAEAIGRREGRTAVRLANTLRRKARRAGLTPAS